MASNLSSSSFLLTLPLLLITILTSTILELTTSAPTHLSTYCPNTSVFSSISAFKTNRNTLLTSLAESNNKTVLGFRNATVGSAQPAYRIYMCRGDDSEATCSDCVSTAASALPSSCPRETEAVVWYDECLIRYSNTSFLGGSDENVYLYMANGQNITGNLTQFNEVLGSTANDVAAEASNGGELLKFATKEAIYTDFLTLYVLGQCTPNLSHLSCLNCLKNCVGRLPVCCGGRKGGRVVFPSCYLRYETYLFYNPSWASAPPPTTPAQAPVANGTDDAIAKSNGGDKKSSSKAIVVIVPVVLGVAALVVPLGIIVCLQRKRSTKLSFEAVAKDAGVTEELMTTQSLQHHLATLQAATNNFSNDNKIGEGGFGGVYKMGKK